MDKLDIKKIQNLIIQILFKWFFFGSPSDFCLGKGHELCPSVMYWWCHNVCRNFNSRIYQFVTYDFG